MSELARIPRGVRYYFGGEARLRRAAENACMSIFEAWDYDEVTTPTFDYYSLFESGMGEVEAQRAFRFTDTDGRLLALRPDVTASLARAAATLLAGRARPLRLCYAESVFRQCSPSPAAWRRESRHVGGELLGAEGTTADLELLFIVSEILERLGLSRGSCVTLNHVGIFNGVAEELGLEAHGREEFRRILDTRNISDLRQFLAPYGRGDEAAGLWQLSRQSGESDIFRRARGCLTSRRALDALGELERVWEALEGVGLSGHFKLDLGDVSWLDYHTGVVFQIYVAGGGGRVGRGGRYRGLTADYGRSESSVGFIIDLDAVTDALARNDSAFLRELADSRQSRTPAKEALYFSPAGRDG